MFVFWINHPDWGKTDPEKQICYVFAYILKLTVKSMIIKIDSNITTVVLYSVCHWGIGQ